MSVDAVHASERAFFDSQAAAMDADRMPPGPLDPYTRAIVDALGPLHGVRVREVGCGAGDLPLELVHRGATLTALDLSARLVEVTRARLARWAPQSTAEVRVSPLEATGRPADAFARVCGKWVLHHALRERFGQVRCDYPSLYLAEIASRQLLRHRLNRELKAVDSWLWRRVPRLRPYGDHVLLTLRRAVSRPHA